MLVYGDRAQTVSPRDALRALTGRLKAVETAPPGPARHDLLVAAFIEAAALAQGLADAEFEARGCDDLSPTQDAAGALVLTLARKLAASLWSGFAVAGPAVAPELMALAVQPLPDRVSVKTPEGYAFYALDPAAYLKAAVEHPWPAPPLVIGLRSIGTGLAALVAVASRAQTVVTLRPVGHPFRRELRISDRLRQVLAAHDGPFAIADEGPGLSGSSFGATADLLEDLGVGPERIVFFPSHGGDLGPQADPRHRERWSQAVRPVATFEDLTAETPLADWFADLTGPIDSIEDLSGGAWRDLAGLQGERRPPVHAGQERLKFRLNTASGRWLAKFAGLGATGEAKFERARALHRAGFTPEPLALRRGFLLERWEAGQVGPDLPRADLVAHLGRYLAFRAATFPAAAGEGAGVAELVEMAQANAREALGEEAQPLADRLLELAELGLELQRVHVDARLHRWEWRLTPDGLALKTDGLDHSQAHDLVGAQDIAWDLAGAELELGLDAAEMAALFAALPQPPEPAVLELNRLCYAAFQLGYWRMAADAAATDERAGLEAQAAIYRDRLRSLVQAPYPS